MASIRSRRNSLRKTGYDYAFAGAYFVTICVHERRPLFGVVEGNAMRQNALGDQIERLWAALPNRFDNLDPDAFQLMPNHIHAVAVLLERPRSLSGKVESLGGIVRAFKALSTFEYRRTFGDTRALLWQRGYHDRIVRGERELGEIRAYIENNPVAWQHDRENPDRVSSPPDRWFDTSGGRIL